MKVWCKNMGSNELDLTLLTADIVSAYVAHNALTGDELPDLTMTDMGYGRPALANVARTLLRANPNIMLDDNAQALLQTAKSSSWK
jgi:predicted transcriptional regulator